MLRHTLIVLIAVAAGLTLTSHAMAQDAPTIPAGYTPYQLIGEGINAPPMPFKIEGDKITTPEGPGTFVRVTDSQVTDDRAQMEFDTPFGPGRFIGTRDGDALVGLWFSLGEEARFVLPVALVPVGQQAQVEPNFEMFRSAPGISRVEVVPNNITLDSEQTQRFVARAYDEAGTEIADSDVEWFSLGGTINETGDFVGMNAGERFVVAVVNNAIGTAAVTISSPGIESISVYTDVPSRLAVGSRVPLEIDALNSIHRWVLDPAVEVVSSAPDVMTVDAHTLVAQSPGRATVTIKADDTASEYDISVVAGSGGPLSIRGVPSGVIRTGDVVQLALTEDHAYPVWSVAQAGAEAYSDGSFVAERPGRYTVLAVLGDRVATASIEAVERGVSGRIHINGHGKNVETYTSDLWPQNSYVYVGTHQANRLLTFDVSDPASPVLTDEQEFDARVVNDVKVSEDGRWLVATREGATNRRNGILVFSLEDPAQPELVSEYTETLTAGVHNVFWVGDLVYAVNDGTNDLHIIDLSDPTRPREVGRWGLPVVGRSLHDVWVQDGMAYVSYMNDGLVILDVGGGDQGGTPETPVQVSRIFYPGGPTHSAIRHRNYVFVGDEDFSLQGTTPGIPGLGNDPRGPVHVVDVTDPANPKYVAKYEVPEAGAHNFWVDDDVLYIGYYQGGIRVVDVSGELRGDLYAQGREIAYFLPAAGPEDAKLPFAPNVWGVFPMFGDGWSPAGDMFYATDYNSGLWTFTVELPEKPIS
jgi:hypothetical protein